MLIHYDPLPEESWNGQEEVMQNILEGSELGEVEILIKNGSDDL